MRFVPVTERLPGQHEQFYFCRVEYADGSTANLSIYCTKTGFNIRPVISKVTHWLDESDAWTDVKDALPEKRIRVLIQMDFDYVCIGYIDFDGEWKMEADDIKEFSSGLSKVTRWQPLPDCSNK